MRISDWSSDVCSSDLLEIARIAAPECFLRGFDHMRAGRQSLPHYRVDLGFAAEIVAYREFGRAAAGFAYARVMGDAAAFEERKLEPALKIEEGDGAMCEFPPDNADRKSTRLNSSH